MNDNFTLTITGADETARALLRLGTEGFQNAVKALQRGALSVMRAAKTTREQGGVWNSYPSPMRQLHESVAAWRKRAPVVSGAATFRTNTMRRRITPPIKSGLAAFLILARVPYAQHLEDTGHPVMSAALAMKANEVTKTVREALWGTAAKVGL